MTIRDLHNEQEAELEKFALKRAQTVIKRVDSARRALLAEVEAFSSETQASRRLRETLKQIDLITQQLRDDIQEIGPSDAEIGNFVTRHWGKTVAELTGQSFVLTVDAVSSDVITRFSLNEMENMTSITADYARQRVRSILLRTVGIKGENPRVAARQLLGTNGLLTKRYSLLETIARMETSNVYNQQSMNAIEQGNKKFNLSLNKMITEHLDITRNHPISRLINGMVQDPAGQFKIRVGAVEAEAARTDKSATGVVWQRSGAYYVGKILPAHFNERGIIVATNKEPNVNERKDQ